MTGVRNLAAPGWSGRLRSRFLRRGPGTAALEPHFRLQREWQRLALFVAAFLLLYVLPLETTGLSGPLFEAVALAHWYAREHVLLCLVPAFFIAGAVSVFISKGAVMHYLGPGANKILAYAVASVSGTILAVCSCTVLPMFAGIYRNGAGLGPATAFLYSGPAINVLAIVLTAQVLGWRMGLARAVGAVSFSVIIGLLMHRLFRSEERRRVELQAGFQAPAARPLPHTALYFAALVAILVFANWSRPPGTVSVWQAIYDLRWLITAGAALALGTMLVAWFGLGWRLGLAAALPVAALALAVPGHPTLAFVTGVVLLAAVLSRGDGELADWLGASWGFAKQILPLLLLGVVLSGLLLGRPGHEGIIPSRWIAESVGGNSVGANFFASAAGALMYFATLTEIPILHTLMGSGMGDGPALALLLADPALSLPSMLVIQSVLGTRRALAYILLVVLMATGTGMLYGALVG